MWQTWTMMMKKDMQRGPCLTRSFQSSLSGDDTTEGEGDQIPLIIPIPEPWDYCNTGHWWVQKSWVCKGVLLFYIPAYLGHISWRNVWIVTVPLNVALNEIEKVHFVVCILYSSRSVLVSNMAISNFLHHILWWIFFLMVVIEECTK